MIDWLIKVKHAIFGREVTPEEAEAHRREMVKRKAYILGAGAGRGMQPDDDGVVRIHHLSSENEPENGGELSTNDTNEH